MKQRATISNLHSNCLQNAVQGLLNTVIRATRCQQVFPAGKSLVPAPNSLHPTTRSKLPHYLAFQPPRESWVLKNSFAYRNVIRVPLREATNRLVWPIPRR